MKDVAVIALILITAGAYYVLKGNAVGAVSLAVLFLGVYALSFKPRLGALLLYAFIGFFIGLALAIAIGVKTNASGWKSAVLWTLPILGTLLAVCAGKRSNYRLWLCLRP
ncbi:hypothetical protein [Thermococcus sp.]